MNPLKVHKDNQSLYLQRNVLLVILGAMLLSNVVLSIFVLSKSERVVIVPALKEEVSVIGGSGFSESYIEQMTVFFTSMLFDLTQENIGYKSQALLKQVEAGSYHEFLEYYNEEKVKCAKYKLSSKFDMTQLRILKEGREVEVQGLLSSSFGKGSNEQKEVTYTLTYIRSHGKLLLKSFNEKK
jgi:type IV conjugative transfer system protein TraE